MASKAPLRDTSIVEAQLAPHLRKRIATGSSYQYTIVDATDGTGGADTTTIAEYRATGPHTLTADPWCLVDTKLSLPTAAVDSVDVTTTSPWTMEPSEDYDVAVTVSGTVTRNHISTEMMIAIVIGTRDALCFVVDDTFAVTGAMRLPAGTTVRVEARIYSTGDITATATLTDATLTIRPL